MSAANLLISRSVHLYLERQLLIDPYIQIIEETPSEDTIAFILKSVGISDERDSDILAYFKDRSVADLTSFCLCCCRLSLLLCRLFPARFYPLASFWGYLFFYLFLQTVLIRFCVYSALFGSICLGLFGLGKLYSDTVCLSLAFYLCFCLIFCLAAFVFLFLSPLFATFFFLVTSWLTSFFVSFPCVSSY